MKGDVIALGDPIVIAGTKYRVRGIESLAYPVRLLVAAAPKRNATHRATLDGLEYDKRVGVFRVQGSHRMEQLS